jgi:predicted alpha/beta hydrolase family esterase
MKQCIIIHGGEAFDTEEQQYAFLESWDYNPRQAPRKKRRDRIAHALSHEREVFVPQMPNAQNATYRAWKIWFEKYLPYLDGEEIVLVGNSLGGWFLCKRLSENTFPKHIKQLHLVAACISADGIEDE